MTGATTGLFRAIPLAAAVLAALSASAARAQQPTAPGRFGVSAAKDRITVRDNASATVVLRPAVGPFVAGAQCPVTTAVTPTDNGFDVLLTYTNTTPAAAALGRVTIGSFRLGALAWTYDFGVDARRIVLDARAGAASAPPVAYPTSAYSPVAVFGNEQVSIGVSVLYPVLDDRHAVTLALRSLPGVSEPAWDLAIDLDGKLPIGQNRQYSISVRFADPADTWLRTLLPYRDFFANTYGQAQYTRDPRPVSALTLAEPAAQSSANPWGFTGPNTWRPDVYGWAKWTDFIKQRQAHEYSRVMLWRVSGAYPASTTATPLPFRFATRMNDFPTMRATLNAFRSIPAAGLDLGLWWGSATATESAWNAAALTPLDPTNADQAALANAELDMAVGALGATTIGLDAYNTRIPAWDAFNWLIDLRARTPNVKFVTSRNLPDFFHVIAPTFVDGQDIQSSQILADYLVPGHETWAGVNFTALGQSAGHPLSDQDRRACVARLAALGFVPCIFDDFDLHGGAYAAAESWRTDIPADLQLLANPVAEAQVNPPPADAKLAADAPKPPADPPPPPPVTPPTAATQQAAAPTVGGHSRPILRFSSPLFSRDQIDAAVDRARMSTFTKPRHKPLPTEAPPDPPGQPDPPK